MSSPNVLHFFFPLYFDIPSLLQVREKILASIPEGKTVHFHVLDDSAGSDPRLSSLSSFDDITLLEMPHNLGHQRALVFGLRKFLKGNKMDALVITMDSDGEDNPADLPALLRAYDGDGCRPLVLAQRTGRKVSFTFRVFYFFYKRVFWALTGTVIETGNFALYHAQEMKRIIFHPYFVLSYASTLVALGRNKRFVPCARAARLEGYSKMNFVNLAIHGIRMLMPFIDKIAVRGVLVFSFLFTFALLALIVLFAIYSFQLYPVPPWLLLSSLMVLMICFLSICNFVVLVTVFANVQSLALSRLEQEGQ